MTKQELAKMFDHTYLKADATKKEMEKLCNEAKEIGAAMVAINSCQVRCCKELLKGTDIHVGAAISFPLGQTTIPVKVFETKDAIENGADEIDYVVNLTKVKEHNWDYIKDEMNQIVKVCKENKVLVKVIFENCYLENSEIEMLAKIAKEVKPDYIKTSTGFGTGGAKVEDVKLMKETVGDEVQVKAAGGIRTWQSAKEMIEAGAKRLGTSSSLKILEEFIQSENI